MVSNKESRGKKMPYIVSTVLYPSHVVPETLKRLRQMQEKYPPDDDLFTTVVQVSKRVLEGSKSITIVEPKPGKLEETLIRNAKMLAMFTDIEGFESTSEVYFSIDEAISFNPGQ
jgi:hypothetical protein